MFKTKEETLRIEKAREIEAVEYIWMRDWFTVQEINDPWKLNIKILEF